MIAPRIIHLRDITGGTKCGRGGITPLVPITDEMGAVTCKNCLKAFRSAELRKLRSTPDARWQALKDYLTQQIEQDSAVAKEARAAGDPLTARSHGALVSANRSTLAKMRELEAGQ
jgi:hypothetical protein